MIESPTHSHVHIFTHTLTLIGSSLTSRPQCLCAYDIYDVIYALSSNMLMYSSYIISLNRHSKIDWSEPDYDKYPSFATAKSNEAVMRPGDVLYLPTNWFHYIVSLNINVQCNTRSGRTSHYDAFVKDRRCHD